MTIEKKLNSVFHQMYRGERKNEGSFTTGLYELFFKADQGNKRKLVEAFPEMFGEEVPEFGIYRRETTKDNEVVEALKALLAPMMREVLKEWESDLIEATRRVAAR